MRAHRRSAFGPAWSVGGGRQLGTARHRARVAMGLMLVSLLAVVLVLLFVATSAKA